MKIGYFPGCSLTSSARDYGESVVALAKALDVELVEIPDWHCCGATSAHATDHLLGVALPADLLMKAKAAGCDEVLAPCAACFNRLAVAKHEIEESAELKAEVEDVIETKVDGLPKVLNVLEWLDRIADRIPPKVVKKFERKVVSYYGCLLVRPPSVMTFDRVEDPQSMDKLVAAVGGTSVAWNSKTECCGAGLTLPKTSVVVNLGGRVVADAAKSQAEAIVVACPMCHSNLDVRRSAINIAIGQQVDIPVLFITQVIGLALGLAPEQLGIKRHFVPVKFAQAAL